MFPHCLEVEPDHPAYRQRQDPSLLGHAINRQRGDSKPFRQLLRIQ
jgi:hypothetical protein